MLTRGTTDSCLDHLLIASIKHIARRTYERGTGTEDPAVIREGVDSEVKRYLHPWRADVMSEWRKSRRTLAAAVEPTTITDQIRANVREDLEDRLEAFLGRANPEEVRFLFEVMGNYESRSSISPMASGAELALGNAFAYELGRGDRCYPVSFTRFPLAGVPRTGATRVGEVANTSTPVPVSSVITSRSCAEVVAANELRLLLV